MTALHSCDTLAGAPPGEGQGIPKDVDVIRMKSTGKRRGNDVPPTALAGNHNCRYDTKPAEGGAAHTRLQV